MHQFIAKHTTGFKVLLLFIAANIVYVAMVFNTIPKVSSYAEGMKILDMMPMGYNFDYVKKLFDQLGEEGRAIYLNQQIPLDLIYPFLFALSNFLLLAYLFKKIAVKNKKNYNLCLIPVFGGIFDYLENFGTIKMLIDYPDISSFGVQANNIFTILKSGFTTAYFIILIIALLVLFYKKIIRKKR
jgi:hypothetical protein